MKFPIHQRSISERIENIRIQLDSIIKDVDEKYGNCLDGEEIWLDLCKSKDKLGQIRLTIRELEAKK